MSRNRNFVFTFNNYPNTELVDNLNCKYIAYSKEIAPSTGTPHLQGFVAFKNAKTHAQAKRLLPGCYVAPMMGSIAENDSYCSKAGTLIERGEKPLSNDNNGKKEKERWEEARKAAIEGRLEDVDADIYIRCYCSLKNIEKDHMIKPPPVDVRCFWIWGQTGTGKSHIVETTFPDCYKKNMEDMKWFDGYDNHEVVYLEDMDKYQIKWGGMLKRLADKWPMQASIKGSMKYIRPKVVIVTSNVEPSDIWYDPATLDPLLRRFKVIEKKSHHDVIDFS